MRLRLETFEALDKNCIRSLVEVIEKRETAPGAPLVFLSRKHVRDSIMEALNRWGGQVVITHVEEEQA